MSRLNIYLSDSLEGGFSPLYYKSQFDLWGMACLYQGICMYDSELNLCNRLAEYVLQTEKYMEVKIRPLKWHDGNPITSHDFKFSFELFYSPERCGTIPQRIIQYIQGAKSFYKKQSLHISGIEIVDDQIFRIFYEAPYIYAKSLLTLPITPKHCYSQTETKMHQYIGCGSYILKSLEKNSAFFIRNKSFCLGTPRIEELLLLGGSSEEQQIHLQAGDIDLTILDPADLTNLPLSVFQKYYVYSLPQPIATVLKINPSSQLFCNLAARKMVSQKISRCLLIHQLFRGYADPLQQFYPPVVAQHLNCSLIYPDVSPTISDIKILQIGVHKENEEHKQVAAFLLQILSPYFQISVCNYASRTEAYRSGADVYIENMSHTLTPCSNMYLFNNYENFSRAPEYANLLNLSEKLFCPDYSEFIYEFALECANTLPIIPLYSKHEIQLVSKRVHNLRPDTRGAFWNIHELIIAEE